MKAQRMTVVFEVPETWTLEVLAHALRVRLFTTEVKIVEVHPDDMIAREEQDHGL